jgi:hypothetical protein
VARVTYVAAVIGNLEHFVGEGRLSGDTHAVSTRHLMPRSVTDVFEATLVCSKNPSCCSRTRSSGAFGVTEDAHGAVQFSSCQSGRSYTANSFSNAFASFRSRVSNPSVNHP